MTTTADQRRERQTLRLEIGRTRRRIDRRVRTVQREGSRLASWRTYVRRYPGYAMTAGLGLGLSAAAGLSRGRWLRFLGIRLIRRSVDKGLDGLVSELKQVWADAAPDEPTAVDGVNR